MDPYLLSEEMMKLLEDKEFLDFVWGDNPPERPIHSPQINPQETTETPLTNRMTEPTTASSSVPNTYADVGAVTANASPRPRHGVEFPLSGKIDPPFPWATDRRATVHSRKYLLENNILKITGILECKKKNCKITCKMELDLETKFAEVCRFIQRLKDSISISATAMVWTNVKLPTCPNCGEEDSMLAMRKGTKKRAINWLFLFLNQMLCCCSLKQLKYFLKHNNIRKKMIKDRAVYSAYITLCKQLVPDSASILDDISRRLIGE